MVALLRSLAAEAPLIDADERARLLAAWRARPGLREPATVCRKGHNLEAPGAVYIFPDGRRRRCRRCRRISDAQQHARKAVAA